jgi:hypothetical protein
LVKEGTNGKWNIFESEERYIDLAKHFGENQTNSAPTSSGCSTCASANVYSKYAQKGKLWASADGKMTVELNGERVLTKETETEHQFAEYQIDIELKEGVNRLSVYLERSEKGFGFTALLCDDLGDGLFDIEYRV